MKDGKELFIPRIIFILLLLCPIISYAQFSPTQITTNLKAQTYPKVYGDKIVWQDNRNQIGLIPNIDIYMYQLPSGPETQITTNSKNQYYPDIWKNLIVWQDIRDGNWNIYMYDINTSVEQQITSDASYQEYPAVSDSVVVWRDARNGDSGEYDIYMYDVWNGSEARVTSESNYIAQGPKISGHKAVWTEKRGASNSIFMIDFNSGIEKQLSADSYDQYAPDIHGDTVVWLDYRSGSYSIYMYDLSTSTTSLISKYASSQSYPQISESGIVWQVLVDFYNNYEIYFYEFASEAIVPLTTSLYAEENPSIWSNRIVWDDATSGNYDIYYLDFVRPSGADIYVTQTDKPDPILVNGYLTYKITVGNYGFDNATNVTLSNNLSSKEEFYYAESTQGRCDYSGGVVTCNLGDINFKDKVDITIVAIPRDTGYIYNSSTVSANQPDLITSNNSSISKTKVVSYKIEEVPFSREIGELSLDVDSYGSAHISATSVGEFYPKNGDDIIYFTNKNGVWESYRIYDGVADNDSGLGNPHYHLWDGLNSLIALDDQNNVHICYVIYYLDTDVLGLPYDAHYTLKYTNNVGGIWKTAETIATKIEYSNSEYIGAVCRLVSMDIDNNGKAHIAYLTNRAASVSPLYYANNINGQWTNEVIHSSVYDMASMAIDKNNKAHVCFYSYDILENNSHLQGFAYMTNSTNNTWSIPVRVDTIGGQMESMGACIVTDNLNNPHVSYLGGPWGNNKYAFKDGANWTIVKVDTGWGSGWSSLNLDSSGKAHILYTPFYGSDTFRYAQNTSGLFEFADIDESFKYQIQIDDQNKFHMVYDDIYLTNREHSIQYGGGETGTGGYYFATSTSEGGGLPSQPTYEWIDPVSEGHSEITSWTSGDADDGYLQISNLGMTFTFFGHNYNHVFIGSNGYLSFANGSTDNAEYVFVPSSIQPNNFIAGCAMDLDCGKPDSKVFYHSAGSQFIVTYWHVYDKGSDSDYITFQIILYSSGNIKIQFNDSESIVPAPESIDGNALVGIENHDGSEGLSYHNNGGGGSLFGSPLAIMFGKDPYLLPVESSSFKPIDYLLEQNYPNPFNPNTTISWQIPKDGLVTLKIYDVLGREINTLVNEELNAGKHTVVFDASGFSSGVYFYQIKAGDYIATKKMILIK